MKPNVNGLNRKAPSSHRRVVACCLELPLHEYEIYLLRCIWKWHEIELSTKPINFRPSNLLASSRSRALAARDDLRSLITIRDTGLMSVNVNGTFKSSMIGF
jgi:hypothetical protein